jgi:hypothetical protein
MNKNESTKVTLAYRRSSPHSVLLHHQEEGCYCDDTLKKFEDSHGYAMVVGFGGCGSSYPKLADESGHYWMTHFHHAVVRDKADTIELHKTLSAIPEYRNLCHGDIPFLNQYEECDNREYNILAGC